MRYNVITLLLITLMRRMRKFVVNEFMLHANKKAAGHLQNFEIKWMCNNN